MSESFRAEAGKSAGLRSFESRHTFSTPLVFLEEQGLSENIFKNDSINGIFTNILKMRLVDIPARVIELFIKRNGYFPNSIHPALVYKNALDLPRQKNKAAEAIREIFLHNGWSNSWKNGIYDYHHYHSTTHECLGAAMGSAMLLIGGPGGKRIKFAAGDVLILPAGMAHRCITETDDFCCVGAYPQGKEFDINTGTVEEYKKALPRIHKLSIPRYDPLNGKDGLLKTYWK